MCCIVLCVCVHLRKLANVGCENCLNMCTDENVPVKDPVKVCIHLSIHVQRVFPVCSVSLCERERVHTCMDERERVHACMDERERVHACMDERKRESARMYG